MPDIDILVNEKQQLMTWTGSTQIKLQKETNQISGFEKKYHVGGKETRIHIVPQRRVLGHHSFAMRQLRPYRVLNLCRKRFLLRKLH